MAIARAKLVDLTVTRWYHCLSSLLRSPTTANEKAPVPGVDGVSWCASI